MLRVFVLNTCKSVVYYSGGGNFKDFFWHFICPIELKSYFCASVCIYSYGKMGQAGRIHGLIPGASGYDTGRGVAAGTVEPQAAESGVHRSGWLCSGGEREETPFPEQEENLSLSEISFHYK